MRIHVQVRFQLPSRRLTCLLSIHVKSNLSVFSWRSGFNLRMFMFRVSTNHVTMQTGMLTRHLSRSDCVRSCVPARNVYARQLSAVRASKGDRPDPEKDKSWGEIIGDATGLAK